MLASPAEHMQVHQRAPDSPPPATAMPPPSPAAAPAASNSAPLRRRPRRPRPEVRARPTPHAAVEHGDIFAALPPEVLLNILRHVLALEGGDPARLLCR